MAKSRGDIFVKLEWRPFPGFSFTSRPDDPKIRIHPKSIKRFKQRVRELTFSHLNALLWSFPSRL
jgi:hypothetical protein